MGLFFENYLDVLDAQPAWDYAELVHRTRLLLLEAPVSSVLTEEIEGVFCDEFAELDRSQIALLEQVHQVGIPVAATADPQSSVFAFRGADPRAVADFGRRFEVTGLPGPERIDLSTSLPVSYTHLDVYKRQDWSILPIISGLSSSWAW